MRRLLVLLIPLVFYSAEAVHAELLPLESQWSWVYETSSGIRTIENLGSSMIMGAEVRVVRVPETNSVTYRSSDGDGNIYWHGSESPSSSAYFDPPILLVSSDAAPGTSWTTIVQQYCDVDGTEPRGVPAEVTVHAFALESVVVPAGSFTALKMSVVSVPGCWKDRVADVDGFVWYAEGVGLVRAELGANVWSLVRWSSPSVATVERTWSSLKARF